MPTLSRDLGIDLGTINTVICEGNQVLVQEPTMVALLVDEQKIVEWGQAARDMDGRVPESIEVVRPIQNSVIADFEITENFLKVMMRRVSGPMLIFRPRIMITIPYGSSSVETRAVHEAALGAGTRDAYLIHQPLAAALGIDLPIGTPTGNMVISLGGGTTQAAVLAMNSIVAAVSSPTAGLKMDDAIGAIYSEKIRPDHRPTHRGAIEDQGRCCGPAERGTGHGDPGAGSGHRTPPPGHDRHQ